MAIIVPPFLLHASAAASNNSLINNAIIPSVEDQSALAVPIKLFGQDYNECNCILSAMSPSASL